MSLHQLVDLPVEVRHGLQSLKHHYSDQQMIEIRGNEIEVNWSPKVWYTRSLLLPLIVLTTAIDPGAAQARWAGVRFAQALATAPDLDGPQKDVVASMASVEPPAPDNFDRFSWRWGHLADELCEWIDRHSLEGSTVTVDRRRLTSGSLDAHYAVRPVVAKDEMPVILRKLPEVRALAGVAVLCLYDPDVAHSVFKRQAKLNPPVVDAILLLKEDSGSYDNLLRMVAAYRGW
ncbi:hypothetical protein [Belnapia rosea]|uniref:Uncharacterized protein n=1 Tax=Belnapia rosea TaxID=938405 RepID=A0A1G7BTF0_9PROT|nr:hypothetical protein [Belnapia rosea]SDE30411.1 hypothetical protein SAMN04487779_102720 [Belnapia rosea]